LTDPILRIEHVRKHFDGVEAVKDISFEICHGEIFGLLGPNGAGKTTTLRMVIGMLRPDGGSIVFSGLQATALSENMGYLPEERGLYKRSRVRDTLIYFAKLKNVEAKAAQRRSDQWLERFGLAEFAHRRCEELSKGMQQKIQIIAALIHEPSLLIFDEPFSGLDPVNQIFVRDLVVELSHQGKTILLSAHQMDHVEKLCERICMVYQGKSVLYGAVDSLKDQFSDGRVAIHCNGSAKESLMQQAVLNEMQLTSQGVEGKLKTTFGELLQKLSIFDSIQKIESIRPSLEEIFIQQVSK